MFLHQKCWKEVGGVIVNHFTRRIEFKDLSDQAIRRGSDYIIWWDTTPFTSKVNRLKHKMKFQIMYSVIGTFHTHIPGVKAHDPAEPSFMEMGGGTDYLDFGGVLTEDVTRTEGVGRSRTSYTNSYVGGHPAIIITPHGLTIHSTVRQKYSNNTWLTSSKEEERVLGKYGTTGRGNKYRSVSNTFFK